MLRYADATFFEKNGARAREILMPRETWNARSGATGSGRSEPSVGSTQKGIFRKEGEYWTVGYGRNSFRLKDTKGLGYLAHLLRHPATEFHVLDLAGGIASQRDDGETSESAPGLPRGKEDLAKSGIHIGSLGDAGEMLDEQAKVAYRHRLSELREELEEAKDLGNVERAEQAEAEIDALTKELSRAVGLGGRNRKAASASERARQSITKTIKAVVERIAQSHSALGNILSQCIKTGTSAPISLTPISPSRGNSRRRISSQRRPCDQAQSTMPPRRRRLVLVLQYHRQCWRFLRSCWRNELLLWDAKPNALRFVPRLIAR